MLLGGDGPRPLGYLERHVHHDVGVEDGDPHSGEHRLGPGRIGRDRHHPGRAETAYLLGDRLRRPAGREPDPLREPVVGELHKALLPHLVPGWEGRPPQRNS